MTRRQFLPLLGSPLPAARLLAYAPEARRIRITGVEVFQVPVNHRGNWILYRMTTDAGLTGIGDASHGKDPETIQTGAGFASHLKGQSIFSVERLRHEVWDAAKKAGRPGACALSGLEQCLWDLLGKALGVPTYDLFGGALRTKMRNYANINRATTERSPEGFARMAKAAADAGFDAVKLAPWDDMPRKADSATEEKFTQLGLDRARAVRDAIGPERDLLLDAHSHFTLEKGLELLKRAEPLKLFWLEEVTPARPVKNLAEINEAARMPTAGGESIFGVDGYYPYIKANAVDITMPDVKYCGGMLEMKKIAAMSEAAQKPTSPHGPASPVGNVAALHVCATMANFQILEFAFGEAPWRPELIEPHEQPEKGHLSLSERPGFGITLNEKLLAGKRVTTY